MEPAETVLEFWFGAAERDPAALAGRGKAWFAVDEAFDTEIRERHGALIESALAGEHRDWTRTARGRLALVLVLDQFTRNAFRGTGRAFAGDAAALALAEEGVERGHDRDLSPPGRSFLYMPFQHAEDRAVQERSVALFEAAAAGAPAGYEDFIAANARYAREHRDVVARFGRFPHRNAPLGRAPTPEETDYLAGGAARYGQGGEPA